MAHCLSDDYDWNFQYHLANWGLVTQRKEFVGPAILDLAEMNICLLASWVKRYSLDDNKLWKQIVEYKYMVDNPNIFSCSSIGTSPFWEGLVWAIKAAKMDINGRWGW
jgi:hypothetical protein